MGGERHGKGWSRGFRLRCHSDAGDCHLADPSHFSLINQLGFIALTRRPLVWESRNLCCFGILPDGPMELFPPTSSFLLLPPRGHEIFENWTMALIFSDLNPWPRRYQQLTGVGVFAALPDCRPVQEAHREGRGGMG